jgi:hypothetical protein
MLNHMVEHKSSLSKSQPIGLISTSLPAANFAGLLQDYKAQIDLHAQSVYGPYGYHDHFDRDRCLELLDHVGAGDQIPSGSHRLGQRVKSANPLGAA